MNFSDREYWRAIVLYGLNTATYKMGLGQVLVQSAVEGVSHLSWNDLAARFFDEYQHRLKDDDAMPQQGQVGRLTVLERTVARFDAGAIDVDEAVGIVARRGLRDVVPRFQSIGGQSELVEERFYEFTFGEELILTDKLLRMAEQHGPSLIDELTARWSLLEGAFRMRHNDWSLANDVREVYLECASTRKSLTHHVPFLRGYQTDRCFYCAEIIQSGSAHVDHVLPRQVVEHDEVWNLVLAHDMCNILKSDQLVPLHYIHKLYQRNENLVGSSHPWKNKIKTALGTTSNARKNALLKHYSRVQTVLGPHEWEGISGFDPEHDPFYRQLITELNNA